MSTYDDWKTRSDRDDGPQPEPNWYCEECKHYFEDQGCCQCCHVMTDEEIAWERSTRKGEEEMQEGKH